MDVLRRTGDEVEFKVAKQGFQKRGSMLVPAPATPEPQRHGIGKAGLSPLSNQSSSASISPRTIRHAPIPPVASRMPEAGSLRHAASHDLRQAQPSQSGLWVDTAARSESATRPAKFA